MQVEYPSVDVRRDADAAIDSRHVPCVSAFLLLLLLLLLRPMPCGGASALTPFVWVARYEAH